MNDSKKIFFELYVYSHNMVSGSDFLSLFASSIVATIFKKWPSFALLERQIPTMLTCFTELKWIRQSGSFYGSLRCARQYN